MRTGHQEVRPQGLAWDGQQGPQELNVLTSLLQWKVQSLPPKRFLEAPLSFPQVLDEAVTWTTGRDGSRPEERARRSFHRLGTGSLQGEKSAWLSPSSFAAWPDTQGFSSSFSLRMQEG